MALPWVPPGQESLFLALLWSTVVLALLLLGLVLAGGVVQYRRDLLHRRRIARFQAWEGDLLEFLYQDRPDAFMDLPRRERSLFRHFLRRYQPSLGGEEAERTRQLYRRLDLHGALPRRLRHRRDRERALAAQEVGDFQLWELLPQVEPLLKDQASFVAYAAARTLARHRDLRWAQPVLDWVLREELFQQERLLRVLEAFGPELVPWLELSLPAPAEAPRGWRLFALLVAAHPNWESRGALQALLEVDDLDLRASALKALGAVGDPVSYGAVAPFLGHPSWVLRSQAARALGNLSTHESITDLLDALRDPIYEVRYNAGQSLLQLGPPGVEALSWVALDPEADPFARDMALERLAWVGQEGRT